jgi:hypothetical protein
LFVGFSVCLSVCLFVCLSVFLFDDLQGERRIFQADGVRGKKGWEGRCRSCGRSSMGNYCLFVFLFVCLSVSMSFCMSVLSPGRKKNISGRRSPKLGRLDRQLPPLPPLPPPLRLQQLQQHR